MIGHQDRWQEDLFVAAPLSALIPEDHILKRVDRVLDLSWLRDEVRGLYCGDHGRPSINPEATVTADAGYARASNYAELEQRGTRGIIVPQRERSKAKRIPLRRFKYDGKREGVRCPAGKGLVRGTRNEKQGGWWYRSRAKDCRGCRLRARCLPPTARTRAVLITDGYEALLRARRAHARWDPRKQQEYRRHR